MEPPLLEGQVRQSFSEPGPSFCLVLLDNAIVLCVCVGVVTAGQTRIVFSFHEQQLVLYNSLNLHFFAFGFFFHFCSETYIIALTLYFLMNCINI